MIFDTLFAMDANPKVQPQMVRGAETATPSLKCAQSSCAGEYIPPWRRRLCPRAPRHRVL